MANPIRTLSNLASNYLATWQTGARLTSALTNQSQDDKKLATVRNYYDGHQVVPMLPRQQAWLDIHSGAGISLTFNHCQTVVDAVVERLMVNSFRAIPMDEVGNVAPDAYADTEDQQQNVPPPPPNPAPTNGNGSKPQPQQQAQQQQPPQQPPEPVEIDTPFVRFESMMWRWWVLNRCDALQTEIHRRTVRDGQGFIMVSWDEARNFPQFLLHDLHDGDAGVYMVYPSDDPTRPPLYAAKEWWDVDNSGKQVKRRTLYYPDRIEKYILAGRWEKTSDPGDEGWPVPWVDSAGKPLGIPFAHFKQPNLKSEIENIVTLQDAANKIWIDILGAADATAFRTIVTRGFRPTTDGQEPKADGSNMMRITPGAIVATTRPANMTAVDVIDPGDLSGLLNLEERIVLRIASISDTPISRFQTGKQVASDETLKQQEAPLLSKVRERMVLFGNAWEDAMYLGLRQARTFATKDKTGLPDPDEVFLTTEWASSDVRNDLNSVKVAREKKALGVSLPVILKELGYSAPEVAQMMKSPEIKARMQNLTMLSAVTPLLQAQAQNGGNNGSASDEQNQSG